MFYLVGKDEPNTFKYVVKSTVVDGMTHRFIPVEVNMNLKYKRLGENQPENSFDIPAWNISLPISDPRALIHVKEINDDGSIEIHYFIENPTMRIFNFSATLFPIENFTMIRGLKQQSFPILPFSHQELSYTFQPQATGWLKIPLVKIFDLHYNVTLPIIVATEGIKSDTNKNLYIHI